MCYCCRRPRRLSDAAATAAACCRRPTAAAGASAALQQLGRGQLLCRLGGREVLTPVCLPIAHFVPHLPPSFRYTSVLLPCRLPAHRWHRWHPCSEDSATRKAREVAARLKDFGEEEVQQRQQGASGPAAAEQAPLLPSAAAAFTTVGGPPAFLDPEVTALL